MKDRKTAASEEDLTEIGFLEAVAGRLPDDSEVLKAWGDMCTRVGRYEQGLKVDRRLAELCPDEPLVWYNLACSLALLHQRKEALATLAQAIALGYRDYDWMSRDDDLRSLREDQEFKTLLKRIAPQAQTG